MLDCLDAANFSLSLTFASLPGLYGGNGPGLRYQCSQINPNPISDSKHKLKRRVALASFDKT